MTRPIIVEDALVVLAGIRRKEQPVRAWLARRFGRREVFTSHLGHTVDLRWLFGRAYLADIREAP